MNPLGLFLEPPWPLLTHLHTVCMAYSERHPTRLNPPAERTCSSQAPKLAVVLFVHGGGFMNGDSAGGGGPGGIFNGTEMAAAQQVVVVSVNYRMCDAHAARLARMTVCSACRLLASTRAELRTCVRAAHPH